MTDSARDMAIGKLSGQLEMIIQSNTEAATSRKHMHEKMEEIGTDIHTLKNDVKKLGERVGNLEPSVEDYVTKQKQVQGAGKLGKALWVIGGVVLAAAGWLYAAYYSMTGRPPP